MTLPTKAEILEAWNAGKFVSADDASGLFKYLELTELSFAWFTLDYVVQIWEDGCPGGSMTPVNPGVTIHQFTEESDYAKKEQVAEYFDLITWKELGIGLAKTFYADL